MNQPLIAKICSPQNYITNDETSSKTNY